MLVGTPIGNLDDLTARAAATLAQASAIACEDTRRTGRLLAHLGIAAPKLLVANDHTEAEVAAEIVRRVEAGERVALVTDAGMPGIADPGAEVVHAVLAARHPVEVVPGPSAHTTALVGSGLPTARFVFEGFLPRKGATRQDRIAQVAAERRTVILYEAPHRLIRTLEDLEVACGGDRQVALGRELTKLHEEHLRGSLAAVLGEVRSVAPRGEYVIVVGPAPPDAEPDDTLLKEALAARRAAGLSTRDAVGEVAHDHRVSRRRVYDLAIDLDRDEPAGPDPQTGR